MIKSGYKMATTIIDLKKIHVVIGIPALIALLSIAYKMGGDIRERDIMERLVVQGMQKDIKSLRTDLSEVYSQVNKEKLKYGPKYPTVPAANRSPGNSSGCVDSCRGAGNSTGGQ